LSVPDLKDRRQKQLLCQDTPWSCTTWDTSLSNWQLLLHSYRYKLGNYRIFFKGELAEKHGISGKHEYYETQILMNLLYAIIVAQCQHTALYLNNTYIYDYVRPERKYILFVTWFLLKSCLLCTALPVSYIRPTYLHTQVVCLHVLPPQRLVLLGSTSGCLRYYDLF
jgi:hypothetical protein